ncbi:pentapeptide repeat-containing protein [Streptomycetaceae bacterium NBC_01309]
MCTRLLERRLSRLGRGLRLGLRLHRLPLGTGSAHRFRDRRGLRLRHGRRLRVQMSLRLGLDRRLRLDVALSVRLGLARAELLRRHGRVGLRDGRLHRREARLRDRGRGGGRHAVGERAYGARGRRSPRLGHGAERAGRARVDRCGPELLYARLRNGLPRTELRCRGGLPRVRHARGHGALRVGAAVRRRACARVELRSTGLRGDGSELRPRSLDAELRCAGRLATGRDRTAGLPEAVRRRGHRLGIHRLGPHRRGRRPGLRCGGRLRGLRRLRHVRLHDVLRHIVLRRDGLLGRGILRHSTVGNGRLRNIGLGNASLRQATLRDTRLRNAGLRNTRLRHNSGLLNTGLLNTRLRNTRLRNTGLRNTRLRNSRLRQAVLRHTSLRNGSLRHTNLRHAALGHPRLLRDRLLRHLLLRHRLLRQRLLRHRQPAREPLSPGRRLGRVLPRLRRRHLRPTALRSRHQQRVVVVQVVEIAEVVDAGVRVRRARGAGMPRPARGALRPLS